MKARRKAACESISEYRISLRCTTDKKRPQTLAKMSCQTIDVCWLTMSVTDIDFLRSLVNRSRRLVQELSRRCIFRDQNCDISLRLRMPRWRMKVSRPILPILTLKLVAIWQRHFSDRKGVQIGIYGQIPTIRWKFGENPEIICLKFLF